MRIVTDASVGVKWFSSKNEDNIDLALQIRDLKLKNKIEITVPDLFEVIKNCQENPVACGMNWQTFFKEKTLTFN